MLIYQRVNQYISLNFIPFNVRVPIDFPMVFIIPMGFPWIFLWFLDGSHGSHGSTVAQVDVEDGDGWSPLATATTGGEVIGHEVRDKSG